MPDEVYWGSLLVLNEAIMLWMVCEMWKTLMAEQGRSVEMGRGVVRGIRSYTEYNYFSEYFFQYNHLWHY